MDPGMQLKGVGASPGLATGRVVLIRDVSDIHKIESGDILVAKSASPDLTLGIFSAGGVVTDYGGYECHAATIAREMGIPCVVGTHTATAELPEGQLLSIDGTKGTVSLCPRKISPR